MNKQKALLRVLNQQKNSVSLKYSSQKEAEASWSTKEEKRGTIIEAICDWGRQGTTSCIYHGAKKILLVKDHHSMDIKWLLTSCIWTYFSAPSKELISFL